MSPSQLSMFLNHIASKIEASKNPKRELVIRDLKNVLAAISEEESKLDEIRQWINSLNAEADLAYSKLKLGEKTAFNELNFKFDQISTLEKKGAFDYGLVEKTAALAPEFDPNREYQIQFKFPEADFESTINPGSEDWPDFWDALNAIDCTTEEHPQHADSIVMYCPSQFEKQARQIIEDAKFGKFGDDVKTYWDAAKEVQDEWTTEDEKKFDEQGGFDPFED